MGQDWGSNDRVLAPGAPRSITIGTPRADPARDLAARRTQQIISTEAQTGPLQLEALRLANEERRRKLAEDGNVAVPGDNTLSGDAYLKTLPPALAAQVKALSEGRRAFPTGAALRSPAIASLVAAATQYDPTLDAANAATRVKTRADFTSGVTARNVTAINTALGHLGSLSTAADAMGNRSVPAWNAIANTVEQAGGDPRVSNFNIKRQAVVDELERAFRGAGGGSEAGIKAWKESINSSQSPEQLRGAISAGVELLNSRLEALNSQYSAGMGRSSDPLELLNPHARQVFQALGPGGTGQVGGPAPSVGGGGPPPPNDPMAPNGPLPPDVGHVATGSTRQEHDPVAEALIELMVKGGKSADEINTELANRGASTGVTQDAVESARSYLRQHPGYSGFARSMKTVDQGIITRAAATPIGAAIAGATNAGTMGFMDEIGGAASALAGGDYTATRDHLDLNKKALGDAFPVSNLVGNVAGGIATAVGGPALAARAAPGALGMAGTQLARLGAWAPRVTDAAYGAAYGAGENNDNRGMGAVLGAATGVAGGMAGRGALRGMARVISPEAGTLAPVYAAGAFPSIGQRAAAMTGPIAGPIGRAISTAEQAMQRFPLAGSLVTRARTIPRENYQLGGFNDALGDIGQQLPAGMRPGTEPHTFASQAFGDAYDTARAGMQFAPDPQYHADAQAFDASLNDGILAAPQVEQVRNLVASAVDSRLGPNGVLDGAGYQAAGSHLRRAADQWSRNPATAAQAHRLGDYITAFDQAARRSSHPDAVAALDAADTGYAKLVRLQNASARAGGEPGEFSPTQLLRATQQEAGGVRSGPFLRGDALMQDYATAGRPLSDTLGTSGTAENLGMQQILAGGGIAGAGSLGVPLNPAALAAFAPYTPGLNFLATRAMAPNAARLPGALGARLDALAGQIEQRAPIAGRLLMPGALAWSGQQ